MPDQTAPVTLFSSPAERGRYREATEGGRKRASGWGSMSRRSGLIGHMPADSHDRHQEEQRDQKEQDSRYRVIAHAAGAFEPRQPLFIAIHQPIRGAIG